VLWAAAPAVAAFVASVAAQASFSAYTVPVPPNLRCTGSTLLNGSIAWSAVTPPTGATVSYVVTLPDGRTTATAQTRYALGILNLVGVYRVQAVLSAGRWTSAPASINVTNVLGVLVC
jgi:hypothetical protein